MVGTVAPGKQCVIALKKRIFLVIESPIISVVGGKRGRSKCGDELPGSADEDGDFEGDFDRDGGAFAGGALAGGAAAAVHRGAGVNCGMERRRAPGRVECLQFLEGGDSGGGV